MLTLTENASAIVNRIATQSGMGESAGLRITANSAPGAGLEVTTAPDAEPGDQIVEYAGATIYLDQGAAQILDHKELDASVDESGNVAFGLNEQA